MKIAEVIIRDPRQGALPLEGGHYQAPITSKQIAAWRSQMCAVAQEVYNEWDQSDAEYGDPELGFGGICDRIAEAIGNIIARHGVDTATIGADDHASLAANLADGVFEIDIPPHVYETGGWYNWKKRPDVVFRPADVMITRIERPMSPEEFEEHFHD